MHTQGHQHVGEILGTNNIIHTTTTAVDGVEHQRPNKSKMENGIIGFHKQSTRYSITIFGRF